MTEIRTLSLGLICAFGFFLSIGLFADEADLSAEQWYRNLYAPLWADDPAANIDNVVALYTPSFHYHSADEGLKVVKTSEWMNEVVTRWVAEGWLNSELADLEAKGINASTNASTFAFHTRWRDHYRNQDSVFSCGWYVVDKTDGGWIISGYADTECKD
jgi:hypothetical protein